MQHRSVTSLQGLDPGSMGQGSGNYSRTPELRVSHKMAERKRRSEMKNLFDELNQILPNSPGSKSSKWEILTKCMYCKLQLRFESTNVMKPSSTSKTWVEHMMLLEPRTRVCGLKRISVAERRRRVSFSRAS
jgi:hypothetical protein